MMTCEESGLEENIKLEITDNPYGIVTDKLACVICDRVAQMSYRCVCVIGFDFKHFVCDECTKRIDPELYEELIKQNEEWVRELLKQQKCSDYELKCLEGTFVDEIAF